jgi:hypothetical protein
MKYLPMPPNNPNFTGIGFFSVLRIQIHMFLGLPDPDPLVRGTGMDPDPALDPDPLDRGMDPRIQIHPKMSWIRNTGFFYRRHLKTFVYRVRLCRVLDYDDVFTLG